MISISAPCELSLILLSAVVVSVNAACAALTLAETEEAVAVVFTAVVTAEMVGATGATDGAAAERPAAMPPLRHLTLQQRYRQLKGLSVQGQLQVAGISKERERGLRGPARKWAFVRALPRVLQSVLRG